MLTNKIVAKMMLNDKKIQRRKLIFGEKGYYL